MSRELEVIWAPIWPITAIVPIIGHVAIRDPEGIIHEFAGSYYVRESMEKTIFGKPTKRFKMTCDPEKLRKALAEAKEIAEEGWKYNLFSRNCHHFVALVLSIMTGEKWSVPRIVQRLALKGRFLSGGSLTETWSPFLVIATLVILWILLGKR